MLICRFNLCICENINVLLLLWYCTDRPVHVVYIGGWGGGGGGGGGAIIYTGPTISHEIATPPLISSLD